MPIRILIADDNPQGVELLEAYLDELGAEIRTVGDGEATLKMVKEWKPDLLLLDIMMPRMSGFEVCKRLRAAPETSNLAVMMITALDQAVDVDRAVEAGTDDFLTKPIDKTELLLRVRALLQASKSEDELERVLEYVDTVQHGVVSVK